MNTNARIYLHPHCTLQTVHDLFRSHQLVAISRPWLASQRRLPIELIPAAPPPWQQPREVSA